MRAGDPRGPGNNCPHPHPEVLIEDIANPAHPHAAGEIGPPSEFTSYSSHNPTVLPDLAFIDWHSGGLQVIDISDPADPRQAG